MAKRLLDDSLLTSPSLASVSPGAQDAFPRLVLLADDFGCFDADPRIMIGRAWPLRPDVTPNKLRGWMAELAGAGMVRVWCDDTGRWFAYLTGWQGAHGQRHRSEYHPTQNPKGSKRRYPKPPEEQSAQTLQIYSFQESPIKSVPADFPPVPAQSRPNPDTQSQSQSGSDPQSQSQVKDLPSDEKRRPAAERKTPDPRAKPLKAKLHAVFAEVTGKPYADGGVKDNVAMRQLLALGGEAEIETRWRVAVALTKWPGCSSIAQLASRWNEFSKPTTGPPVRLATAAPAPHEAFKTGGEVEF